MSINYDNISKEELITDIEKLKEELNETRNRCKAYEFQIKNIQAERPGYKWRWSDERLIALNKQKADLERLMDLIREKQYRINEELEFIKKANNGGSERSNNYYNIYDRDLYIKEFLDRGYINGFML